MNSNLQFKTIRARSSVPASADLNLVILENDGWNDYSYRTLYHLHVNTVNGYTRIGPIKIGRRGMADPNDMTTNIPETFNSLTGEFFSLGQGDEFYNKIINIERELRDKILNSLNDVVYNSRIWHEVKNEDVMKTSLLRTIPEQYVTGQFKRILDGFARLTSYNMEYTQYFNNIPQIELKFESKPDTLPPTNIHVIIGRNGIGKTHMLRCMTSSMCNRIMDGASGAFKLSDKSKIYNLVTVSFSAFDPFESHISESMDVQYTYVGLKKDNPTDGNSTKSPDDLANDFIKFMKKCMLQPKKDRWVQAITTLNSDPIFSASKIIDLATLSYSSDNHENNEENIKLTKKIFARLSSGHKIVLLSTTALVATVEECTLVLLDEPESHLHPPLLSSFTRALSELLINRNGIAIVATHSPVILQEVPKSCIWIINRSGLIMSAMRPSIETFGASVGTLTHEVFGLEVTNSGFYKILEKKRSAAKSYDEFMDIFNNELGAEAKSIALSFEEWD